MDNSMEIARWEEDLSWASADVRGAGPASGTLRAAVRQGHAAHGFVSTLLLQQLHAESELSRQTAELAASRGGELARLRTSARECISWAAPFDSAALTGLVRRYIGLLRELRGCVDVTTTEAGALLDPENAPTLSSVDAGGAGLGRTASSGITVGDLDGSALTDALADFDRAVRSIAVARGDLIRQHAEEQKASAAALATTIAGTMASRVEALVNQHVADNATRMPEVTIRNIVEAVADSLKQARPVADLTLALCCTGDDAETQGIASIVRDAPERVLLSLRRFDAPPRPSTLPRSSAGPQSGRPSSVASPTSRQHLRDAGQAYRADVGDFRRRTRAEVVDVDAVGPSSPLSAQAVSGGQQQARRQPQPPTPLGGQGRASAGTGAHATAAVRMSSGRPSGLGRPSGQQAAQHQQRPPSAAAADDDVEAPASPKRHNLFNLFGML